MSSLYTRCPPVSPVEPVTNSLGTTWSWPAPPSGSCRVSPVLCSAPLITIVPFQCVVLLHNSQDTMLYCHHQALNKIETHRVFFFYDNADLFTWKRLLKHWQQPEELQILFNSIPSHPAQLFEFRSRYWSLRLLQVATETKHRNNIERH